jgi:RNA polymerase sigma-70 factor, ECF subfamily
VAVSLWLHPLKASCREGPRLLTWYPPIGLVVRRLRSRVDPSDVLQEAFLEATERRPEYTSQADPMPPFLWLRFLTLQRLQLARRRQLGTKSRDAGREVSINGGGVPAAT